MKELNGTTGSRVLKMDDGGATGRDAGQLSKLSSVLNGLEGGARRMHRHVQLAQLAVKAGTYCVDPLQLSKRIVGEAMRTV